MIINPADVIAAPLNETAKLRVCRFFFAMTLDESEKYILDEEGFDVTDLGDVFEEKYLKDAHNFVMNNFAEEVKRHTFNIPNINTKEIENTLDILNSMYNVVKNRVKTL